VASTYFKVLHGEPKYSDRKCDDCGRTVCEQGNYFGWNPNRRARIVVICAKCHLARKAKKQKAWEEFVASKQKVLSSREVCAAVGIKYHQLRFILDNHDIPCRKVPATNGIRLFNGESVDAIKAILKKRDGRGC